MAQTRFDAIIVDAGFFGILPFLLGDRAARPPVLAYTTTPLMFSSRDTAPSGMGLPPSSSALGRLRNRALNLLSQKVLLRQSQNAANYLLDQHEQPPAADVHSGFRRCSPIATSRRPCRSSTIRAAICPPTCATSARSIPRRRTASGCRRGGPNSTAIDPSCTSPRAPSTTPISAGWWSPTIEALGGEDVIVVATTGGRDASQLKVPLPTNTFVAEYIPHDLLLPKVDVMVTNGGYGAVQRALSTGVPLVVAGNTEDKPEVAARVAWTGAGVNLRTGTPTPGAVRAAVRDVLGDGRYLGAARKLEAAFARRDGVAEIAALVDEVIGEHRAAVAHVDERVCRPVRPPTRSNAAERRRTVAAYRKVA